MRAETLLEIWSIAIAIGLGLGAASLCASCLGACVSAQLPADCYRRATQEALDYRAELKERCGAFARNLEQCPDYAEIEARYRALDRSNAEACVP